VKTTEKTEKIERMNTRHKGQRGDKNYADMLNPSFDPMTPPRKK